MLIQNKGETQDLRRCMNLIGLEFMYVVFMISPPFFVWLSDSSWSNIQNHWLLKVPDFSSFCLSSAHLSSQPGSVYFSFWRQRIPKQLPDRFIRSNWKRTLCKIPYIHTGGTFFILKLCLQGIKVPFKSWKISCWIPLILIA